jgi:hypothetical protein
MKRTASLLAAAAAVLVLLSCSSGGGVTSKMTFYHGQTIPDQFFRVIRWSPSEVEFEIKVDFKVIHMYHIILDAADRPIAEGWFSTKRTGTAYTVAMKPIPGQAFEAGKPYRLCIGSESPEKVYITTSNYRCVADYEFTLGGE